MKHGHTGSWSGWSSPSVAVPFAATYTVVTGVFTNTIQLSGPAWATAAVATFIVMTMVEFRRNQFNRKRSLRAASVTAEQLSAEILHLEEKFNDSVRDLGPRHQVTIALRDSLDEAHDVMASMRRAAEVAQNELRPVRPEYANQGIDQPSLLAIGAVFLSLPTFVAVGHALVTSSTTVMPSLSAYYHTDMRDLIVGSLCAVGVLFSRVARVGPGARLSSIASFLAISAALLPEQQADSTSQADAIVGLTHGICLAMLMILVAVFCFRVFPQPEDVASSGNPRQRLHNRIYMWCGALILSSMVMTVLGGTALSASVGHSLSVKFWGETLGLAAFGAACFVRGGAAFRTPSEISTSSPVKEGGETATTAMSEPTKDLAP